MFLWSCGWYCSACFGILFVSILCMCCSHFPGNVLNPWHNLHKRSCLTLELEGAAILHSVRNHLSSETVSHSQVHRNYITRTGSSPQTECPETEICEGLKAVIMMMSINFRNIMPTFQMNMLPPSPFQHTKACNSSGHAFSMLVMNCNLSSESIDRNNFTVVSVIINSQAKEFTCNHLTCSFITITYIEINTFFIVGSKFH